MFAGSLFQPVGAVGGVIGYANGIGGKPNFAAARLQQIVIHPEEDAPGGIVLGGKRVLRGVVIGSGRVADALCFHAASGSGKNSSVLIESFFETVDGFQTAVPIESVSIRSMAAVAAIIRPHGAEGDFLLADGGFPLWEEELPVLVQQECALPVGAVICGILAGDGGGAVFSQIVIDGIDGSVSDDALHRLNVPGRAFLGEQNVVALLVHHRVQGGIAALQSGLFFRGKLLPINAEAGIEGGGFRNAGNGLNDAIIS